MEINADRFDAVEVFDLLGDGAQAVIAGHSRDAVGGGGHWWLPVVVGVEVAPVRSGPGHSVAQ